MPIINLSLLLSINGLRYLNGHVYYINSPHRLFIRYPINPCTGAIAGKAHVLTISILLNDFNVRKKNNGPVEYLARLNNNVITRVTLNRVKKIVADRLNSLTIASATSSI